MSRPSVICAFALTLPTLADAAPRVVTDIPPVQGLVAAVMEGVGEPAVLLPPGASPHDVALRPSEARALGEAEVVVWVGPALSPGIARAVETAPKGAHVLTLMEAPETRLLPTRDVTDHDHDHDHAAEAARDHAAEATPTAAAGAPEAGTAQTHAAEDGHDHEGHDHGEDGHDHGPTDPHVWLDPANARAWLPLIAAALAKADPANAAAYTANAAKAHAAIADATTRATATLAPVHDRRAVVFHDAYAYWEGAFGVARPLAISASDAAKPGAAHLAALKAEIAQEGVTCMLTEPQFNPKLATLVSEGTTMKTALWDPLGSTLAAGPGLYPALIEALAKAYADCAG